MISFEVADSKRPTIYVRKAHGASIGAWADLQTALARGVTGGGPDLLEVRAEVFFAELAQVRAARDYHRAGFVFGDALNSKLATLSSDRRRRDEAVNAESSVDSMELARELLQAGFDRKLKPFQLRNLGRLLQLPHGADFSVPGAGKTSVALANFSMHRARGLVEKLLVIGPISSFEAWVGDSAASMNPAPKITVHGGPTSKILESTDILLTNYHRAASDYGRIYEYVESGPTQIVLDESHRIKRGAAGVHGRAVLDLAYAARRRDILTGTPAPQGAGDLVAPMSFLYPGQDRSILPTVAYDESRGRDVDVVTATSSAISRYFVRTNKSELDIPDPVWNPVIREMSPVQRAIYESLVGRYRGSFALPTDDRRNMRRLGRVLMYLLEAAVNPSLLVAGSAESDPKGFHHPPLEIKGDESVARLLSVYQRYERPWKYDYVRDAVTSAAAKGEKVLVWTTFVRNISALSRELKAFNPAIIHGGVPSETSGRTSATTREAELRRFREDADCSVLLANPSAAGEGISLHHWCHHAIYVDRTYNAGHFLQSQDRIHRLGLSPDVETRFTVLISKDSIDDAVDSRLREKVSALSRLMNDPGLVRVALPEPDELEDEPPAEMSDTDSILGHLKGRE